MSFLSDLLRRPPRSAPATSATADSVGQPAAHPAIEVGGLPFDAELLRLAVDERSESSRAAQRRIAELIDRGVVAVEQLPMDSASLPAMLAIAASTSDAAHFELIARHITAPAMWIELASRGANAKLRQLAASRIEAADDLRVVMKAARERDKSVYRIAKTNLDALNAAAKRIDERRAHLHSLAETLEHHSYKPFDGAFVATVEHLERQWRALDSDVPPQLRPRVEAAIDRARETIAAHIRTEGAKAAREAAIANAYPLRASVTNDLKELLATLYQADAADGVVVRGAQERITKLLECWHDTLQYQQATLEETRELEQFHQAVQHLSEAIVASGPLPQLLQSMRDQPSDALVSQLSGLIRDHALLGERAPQIAVEAQDTVSQWHAEQASARAAAENAQRNIAQLIRKAQHALDAGHSRQAFGIRKAIEEKLEHWPTQRRGVADRLLQLDAKLREIDDWRSFAVAPKRGELVEQMRALIGAAREPTQLAEEIKRLQLQWQALAKGTTDSQADWEAFNAAGQAAYAPCKAHFEARAQARERNLERRKALVVRLERYEQETDWEHVEWKHVANAVRSAKQQWRDAGPTERAAMKSLQQTFDELLARIQSRLDHEYAANLERQQALVKQAERLAASEDLAHAASEVKRLQSAWRDVGLTPHAEGQQSWEEFRRHCDAVFERRRRQHDERMAEIDHSDARARELCVEAENLSRATGAELLSGSTKLRELRDRFAQLGELPRDRAAEIQRRFRVAFEAIERAAAELRRRDVDQMWDSFFEAANRVRVYQLEPDPDQKAALRQYIESIERWPKNGRQAVEEKLARDPAADAATCVQNAAALRTLVLRAEIAAGAQTPEIDQAQRRAMQLQALVQGFGRDVPAPRDRMEALAFEWVEVGPVPTQAYDELFARFMRSWALARKGR